MNHNRFNLILKFLHFNNNEDPTFDQNDGNRNRLHKVRPLINIYIIVIVQNRFIRLGRS